MLNIFPAVLVAATVTAVLSLPRWLFVTVNRQSIWRIRDRVWDARMAGIVADDPTTQSVIELAEAAVIALPHFTPQLVRQLHRAGKITGGADSRWPAPANDSMIYNEFSSILNVSSRALVTNSWSGMALLAFGIALATVHKISERIHISNAFGVNVSGVNKIAPSDIRTIALHHAGNKLETLLAAV